MEEYKKIEKRIAVLMIKRELAKQNLSAEKAAQNIHILPTMMRDILEDKTDFYAAYTLVFWATLLATGKDMDDVIETKLTYKACKIPNDIFYREVWQFIANLKD